MNERLAAPPLKQDNSLAHLCIFVISTNIFFHLSWCVDREKQGTLHLTVPVLRGQFSVITLPTWTGECVWQFVAGKGCRRWNQFVCFGEGMFSPTEARGRYAEAGTSFSALGRVCFHWVREAQGRHSYRSTEHHGLLTLNFLTSVVKLLGGE